MNCAIRVNASTLDEVLVNRMFGYLEDWKMKQEASGNVGASIYEELQKEEPEEEPASTKAIDEQLAQIEPKLAHYNRLVDKGYGLPDEKLQEYGQKLAELMQTRQILTDKRSEIEAKAEERAESKELVDEAVERWNKYTLNQKRRVNRRYGLLMAARSGKYTLDGRRSRDCKGTVSLWRCNGNYGAATE
jgi:hypothetical protein